MKPMILLTVIGITMITTGAAMGQNAQPAAKLFTNIRAVRVFVANLNEAIGFYTGLLHFDIVSRDHYPDMVELKNDDDRIILVACGTTTEFNPDLGCRFNLNLYVENLDDYLPQFRSAGVRVLDDTALTAGVGRYIRILDPSGNQIHIMELGYEHDPVTKPTVYNVGARISNMAVSRRFYEDLLDFEVFSEKYYPPVIPYKVRGYQLILHEGGSISTSPSYPHGSQTALTLVTSNLVRALKKLSDAGIEPLLSQNAHSPAGNYNAVRDPDGNVIEILELNETDTAK